MLVPPNHQVVVGRVHLGRRAIDAGQGEQLARELRQEHHHGRTRRELLGAQLFPHGCTYLGQVTGGRGRALEVDVGSHVPKDLEGRELGGTAQRLLPFL